ncbi:Rib/alpha-like domain-containing protein [Rothia nasimurium]|uniref:Rib/alpha-like domain-containing protein n=1 Tax=Rothia nasimurium TaxID=85336 RepID=UPI002351B051|nr:Rib/alpha-like domain-containing protein [Rothia nasimurium]
MKHRTRIAATLLSCGVATLPIVALPQAAAETTAQQVTPATQTQASLYSPQYDQSDSYLVVVPDERTFYPPVDYSGELPDGTRFSAAPDTPSWIFIGPYGDISASPTYDVEPGTYTVNVLVTYPDGSVDTLSQPITVINDYYSSHITGDYFPVTQLSWGQELPSFDLQMPWEPGVAFYLGEHSNPEWISVSSSGWISGSVPAGTRPGRYDYRVTGYGNYNVQLQYDGSIIVTEPAGQEGLWYPENLSVEPNGRLELAPPTFANGSKAQGVFSATAETPSWVAIASDGSVVLTPGGGVPSGHHKIPLNFVGEDGVQREVHLAVEVAEYSDVISVSTEEISATKIVPGGSFSNNLVVIGNGGALPTGTTLSLRYSDTDIAAVSLSDDGRQIQILISPDAHVSTTPWSDTAYLQLTYPDGSHDNLEAHYKVVAPPVPEATPEPSSEPVAPTPEETSEVAVPTASAEPTAAPTSSVEPSVAPTPTESVAVPSASAEPSATPTPAESATATAEPTAAPVVTDAAAALPEVTESVVAPVTTAAVATSPTFVPFVEPTLLAASQLSVGQLPTHGLPLQGPRVEQANAASQTAQLSEASSSQAAASPSSSVQQSAQPALARTGAGDSLTILSMVGASLFFVGGMALVAVRRQARSK